MNFGYHSSRHLGGYHIVTLGFSAKGSRDFFRFLGNSERRAEACSAQVTREGRGVLYTSFKNNLRSAKLAKITKQMQSYLAEAVQVPMKGERIAEACPDWVRLGLFRVTWYAT